MQRESKNNLEILKLLLENYDGDFDVLGYTSEWDTVEWAIKNGWATADKVSDLIQERLEERDLDFDQLKRMYMITLE